MELTYLWQPQYYASVEGRERLLYVRSFARSQLQFRDLDGDQDQDLLVGKADGRLAFFQNEGNTKVPKYVLETEDFEAIHEERDTQNQLMYLQKIVDVGSNAVPELADIDNDGDLDLFIGSGDGQIFFYENRGNRLLPKFFMVTPIYMNLNFKGNSVARFADLDGDKALDLVVGQQNGQVWIYFNSGVPTNALFCTEFPPLNPPDPRCTQQPIMLSDISPLGDASPALVDWDRDRDFEIIVGKSDGKMDFHWNRGNPINPKWRLESEHFQFIDIGGMAAPAFHDMNADGYPELFIGTSTSNIVYYENRELVFDRLKAIKELDLNLLTPTDTPERILDEACAQLKGMPECLFQLASALDIPPEVKLTEMNQLGPYLMRPDSSFNSTLLGRTKTTESSDTMKAPAMQANVNTGNNPAPMEEPTAEDPQAETVESMGSVEKEEPEQLTTRNQLWLNTRNFLDLQSLTGNDGHTVPSTADWNKDGKPDLIIGSESGRIYAFENRGEKEPDWWPIYQPELRPNQRRFSAPAFGDLDNDGDLDLISGNRKGRLEYLENQGTPEAPNWIISDVNLAQIDVGSYSVPTLLDIDGDEDLDLFVGNSRGLVIFYENQGTKEESRFIIRSTRFAGVKTDGHAVPAFFAWNDDPHKDLVVGVRNGQLDLHIHLAPKSASVLKGWQLKAENWQEFYKTPFSSPHFADLNRDEKLDLLVGNKEGHLILWHNGGVLKQEELGGTVTVLNQNIIEEDSTQEEEATASQDTEAIAERIEKVSIDPVFELVTSEFGGLQVGKRAVPAFLDLDGDMDLDIVVGNHSGELRLYLQEPASEGEQWLLETTQYLGYKGGRNSSPTFADLDGDGDLDLLVGSEPGKIYYWENQGGMELPDFVHNPTPFVGVTGGRNSVPSVLDLNSDGYKDLLIGNFLGHVRHFYQIPNEKTSHFRLHRRQFLNLDVGLGAIPRIADLNNDSLPDLVIGSDRGRLINFQPVEGKAVNAMDWKLKEGYFDNLQLPVGGAPVFEDLDGDGDLDMIIGTEGGTLEFYRNTGG